jgi:hypothetical protein
MGRKAARAAGNKPRVEGRHVPTPELDIQID